MIHLKNAADIEAMAKAGHILVDVFAAMEELIRPGISTMDIDTACCRVIEAAGALPAFYHYGEPPFPGHVCVSVDDEVVHGIAKHGRILQEGSIVSVDVGALLDGWYSDACRTYPVGAISDENRALIDCAERAFFKGLEQAQSGNRLGDIQAAVQHEIHAAGFGIVRELTGHGIGRGLHEDPSIPNFGLAGHGPRLREGMVLALEPMITRGSPEVEILDDDWTIVTRDGSFAAHYENSFAITADGPVLLTA